MAAPRRSANQVGSTEVGRGRSGSATPRLADRVAVGLASGDDLGTLLKGMKWFRPIRSAGRLTPGEVPRSNLEIPQSQAQQVLRGISRFVVDTPADSSSIVVWEAEGSQLWVDIATTAIVCTDGVVGISVKVGCDQVPDGVVAVVPFSVGTAERPSGLIMSTIDRLEGPDVVMARWSAPIIAFAWEALLELATRLCADLGRDNSKLPLIPGSIGAGRGTLLIQPMSRHDLSGLRR